MDNTDYKLLLDLYETRNITKVAQRLFLSQPAITKRIKRIEAELGCEVIFRNKKGIVFTSVGEKIIPYCHTACQTDIEMRNAINQNMGIVGGTINICASHNFAAYRLPEVIRVFHEQYPNVAINITTGKSSQLYFKVLQDKLVIAILRGDYKWSSEKMVLMTEPMCLISTKAGGISALRDYPYIGHQTDSFEATKIERWAEENGISLNGSIWVDDINACKELVKRGLGWSILPQICLDDFNGEIQALQFTDGSKFLRNTYTMYWGTYAQLLQVRLFLQVLEQFRRNWE